ncbi:MAG: hypothetical protein AB1631_04740 [Acidobacteriota bacterium]
MQPAITIAHLKRNAKLAEANTGSFTVIRSGEWPRKLLSTLLLTEGFLILLYWIEALFPHPEFQALTDLNGEGNLPAWFSSSQILLIATGAGILTLLRGNKDAPSRPFLILFASGAIWWSMDESAQLHERITHNIGVRYVDWLPEFLLSHKAISLLIAVAAIVALRAVWKELALLWRDFRRCCLIAAAGASVCLIGGVVLETLGYRLIPAESAMLWRIEITMEEFFETSGASLILYAVSLLVSQRLTAIASSDLQSTSGEKGEQLAA